MPYIAIKAYPKDEETKKRTVDRINQVLLEEWGCPAAAVTISLEEVKPEDWKEQVEIPEIEPNMDKMMIVSGKKNMSSTLERAGNICIRNEAEADHRTVENVIRRAFWNLCVPGCAEHYVAHVMRPHGDFVPELDLVLERDGQIIGSIMYTKTRLVDEAGEEKQILTFGPVCILPEYQRMGYGKMLMEASLSGRGPWVMRSS